MTGDTVILLLETVTSKFLDSGGTNEDAELALDELEARFSPEDLKKLAEAINLHHLIRESYDDATARIAGELYAELGPDATFGDMAALVRSKQDAIAKL